MTGWWGEDRAKNYDDKSGLAYYWLEANMGRVLLVVAFAGLGLWGLLLEGRDDLDLGRRLVRGMGPELSGIVIAAVTINALADGRQTEQLKAQLIRQMSSRHNEVADTAVCELAHHGWLYDGSLAGVNLFRAGLKACDLRDAIMPAVNLERADLQGARLDGANLAKAHLFEADFANANLQGANLQQAHLQGARLTGANLMGANLTGALVSEANLAGADLTFADLKNVRFMASNLSKANFFETDLSGADLGLVNLTGAHLTVEQLKQARALFGATMPDGVQLGWDKNVQGPTFKEWKAHYLATHSGTAADLRDIT